MRQTVKDKVDKTGRNEGKQQAKTFKGGHTQAFKREALGCNSAIGPANDDAVCWFVPLLLHTQLLMYLFSYVPLFYYRVPLTIARSGHSGRY